jgi:hypothetical protein
MVIHFNKFLCGRTVSEIASNNFIMVFDWDLNIQVKSLLQSCKDTFYDVGNKQEPSNQVSSTKNN